MLRNFFMAGVAFAALTVGAQAADLSNGEAPAAQWSNPDPAISATFALYGGLTLADGWGWGEDGATPPATLGFNGTVNLPLQGRMGLQVDGFGEGSFVTYTSDDYRYGIGVAGFGGHLYWRDPESYAFGVLSNVAVEANGWFEDASVRYAAGVEGALYSGPFTLYGQAAWLDTIGSNNYDTQGTAYAKLVARYFLTPNAKLQLTADYYASGTVDYGEAFKRWGVELEGEYKFNAAPVSLFASVGTNWTDMNAANFTDTRVLVGARLFVNQPTLLDNDRHGPSFDQPFPHTADSLNVAFES